MCMICDRSAKLKKLLLNCFCLCGGENPFTVLQVSGEFAYLVSIIFTPTKIDNNCFDFMQRFLFVFKVF